MARKCPHDRDRGSATVMGLALTVIAVVLIGLVGFAARCTFIQAHAEGTADLAALAAADAARGKAAGEPCTVAKQMIEREGLSMGECLARTDLARVKVEVKAKMPAPIKPITAEAVAGAPEGRY